MREQNRLEQEHCKELEHCHAGGGVGQQKLLQSEQSIGRPEILTVYIIYYLHKHLYPEYISKYITCTK